MRLKLFRSGDPLHASDVLPILEHLGANVADERPYEVTPDGSAPFWIYDFGLHCDAVADVDTAHLGEILHEAFASCGERPARTTASTGS